MRNLSLSVLAMVLAGTLAACSDNTTQHTVDGDGLRVDVVAPKEPEIVPTQGQLSVGELADGYDHAATMQRAQEFETVDEDLGTSWNDESWAYEDGTGPAIKQVPQSEPDRDVKVTKVPAN